MAEAAKTQRRVAKGKYTNAKTGLKTYIGSKAIEAVVRASYDQMCTAYDTLEEAHHTYLEAAGIDTDDPANATDAKYLDTPFQDKMDHTVQYSKYIEDLVKKEEERNANATKEAAIAAFSAAVESFGKPSVFIQGLCDTNEISHADMREEVRKMEKKLEGLTLQKNDLIRLDPSADWTEAKTKFAKEVCEDVDLAKKAAMTWLKKNPVSATEASVDSAGASAPAVHSSHGAAKREAVKLPKFSGDEKQAFQSYPVWSKQWGALVARHNVDCSFQSGHLYRRFGIAENRGFFQWFLVRNSIVFPNFKSVFEHRRAFVSKNGFFGDHINQQIV